jgi:acyl-CoA synthetase (AMP-forming)/AMP-acid ligase II
MSQNLTKISDLLAEGRPPATPVAVGRDGVHTFADFTGHVRALIERISAAGPGRWLVFSEDSYGCAVALLALAHTGSSAVLAPNQQPEMLRRLARDVTGALADPGFRALALGALPVLHPLNDPLPGETSFGALDRRAPFVELLTSGTTGEGKAIPKALRHFDDEIEVLEAHFGGGLSRETQVFSTVSHQHLYGLLFRLLWPLAAGRPFHCETFLHPEELFPRMEKTESFVLATTPVHLKRMRGQDGLRLMRRGCRAVFSSGSPLDPRTAGDVERALGAAPFEIFGSTETGGVAWRQQSADGNEGAWTPLERVRIESSRDGSLVLRSPFVSVGDAAEGEDAQRITMSDRAELRADGSFVLLGRGDRVVKVGEKRLSLPEMEDFLESHPFVSEARLLSLEHGAGTRVGAVLVLTAAGGAALEQQGRRGLGRALGHYLAGYWDRVLVPRVWRYVDDLPRNAQGKTPAESLERILRDPVANRDSAPVLYEERREPNRLVRRLGVPRDLSFLEGHFEGLPVVAGVVQVHWAMDAASELLGSPPRVNAIEALKFHTVLRPGDAFDLEVELSEDGRKIRFRLSDGPRIYSSGRCRLKNAEPGT